jgi:hypothetical protein
MLPRCVLELIRILQLLHAVPQTTLSRWSLSVVACLIELCLLKRPIHCQLNWAILLCNVIPNGKNWVHCLVMTGNSAGLRTVLSNRLSHRVLCSLHRESHSFLSLHADITMAPSQGTQQQHPFLAVPSADEHRMMYSFSDITLYSSFSRWCHWNFSLT